MTQPAEVTSAADWADLVAALRNVVDLIEGFYFALIDDRDSHENDPDEGQQRQDDTYLEPDDQWPGPDPDPESRAGQEEPVTDPDREAEEAAEREQREDYEADGELDSDYDQPLEPDLPDLDA